MKTCLSYERCGACQSLKQPYAEQLARKRDAVLQAFRAEGLHVNVREVCGMEEPYYYRNKVIAAVSMQGGRVVCGLYEAYSHKVVPVADCLLHDTRLNAVLATLESTLNKLKIKPFGYGGVLKHLLLRVGVKTGQVMVVLVTSEELMHGRKELLARLRTAHPEVATVVQNIQPRQTSVVLGEREKVLFGPGYIFDELLGLRYKISARSFYQINPAQTERLYAKALDLAGLRPGQLLLDAYCGIGTIGLSAAAAGKRDAAVQNGPDCPSGQDIIPSAVQEEAFYPSASRSEAIDVLGVEINWDAVRDAVANARANGIRNARFICDDVSAFMRESREQVDVLILDPPRAGCDEDFLRSVLRLSPARIVYVSCNPVTQARDLAYLTGGRRPAYQLASDAWPFDLFPHTDHVENVIALSRV